MEHCDWQQWTKQSNVSAQSPYLNKIIPSNKPKQSSLFACLINWFAVYRSIQCFILN